MHPSVTSYLATLSDKRRSPHTLKAARQDLTRFVTWWEERYGRPFDPSLLLYSDLRDWRLARQQTDGAAPATINRARSTLRRFCAWIAFRSTRPATQLFQAAAETPASRDVFTKPIVMMVGRVGIRPQM